MHFDFKAYDFADTGSARDAIAVVDARGVLRWDALQAAVQAWEQTALNAGAVAGVPIVISGHKETAFLVAMLGCLRLRVPFVPVDVINPPERIKRIGELVRAGLRYDAQAQASSRAAPAPAAARGRTGLHHVHVRQHRRPQGRADRARKRHAVRGLDP